MDKFVIIDSKIKIVIKKTEIAFMFGKREICKFCQTRCNAVL